MNDIAVIIVEKHGGILGDIDFPTDNLVNFDWYSDYPLYILEIRYEN